MPVICMCWDIFGSNLFFSGFKTNKDSVFIFTIIYFEFAYEIAAEISILTCCTLFLHESMKIQWRQNHRILYM